MEKLIESVQIVSDGIIVRFSDGVLTYFPQGFLRENVGVGSNQIFVDHEQSFDYKSSKSQPLTIQ